MTTKEKILLIVTGLVAVALMIFFTGCSMFGNEAGSDATSSPESEFQTEMASRLESVKKRVEDIEKNYNVGGDLTEIRNEITDIKKEINHINQTISIQKTQIENTSSQKTTNSTFFVLVVLGFVILKDLIRAWRESGSTLKNFIGLVT